MLWRTDWSCLAKPLMTPAAINWPTNFCMSDKANCSRGRHPGGREAAFRTALAERQARHANSTSGIRNTQGIKIGLDRSVFASGPVQGEQDHVARHPIALGNRDFSRIDLANLLAEFPHGRRHGVAASETDVAFGRVSTGKHGDSRHGLANERIRKRG